jgi:hypothetical protein
MFWGGWLYFRDSGDTSEIIIDKKEVQQDTDAAVEKGTEAVKQATEGLQKLGQEISETVNEDAPAKEGEKEVQTGADVPVP